VKQQHDTKPHSEVHHYNTHEGRSRELTTDKEKTEYSANSLLEKTSIMNSKHQPILGSFRYSNRRLSMKNKKNFKTRGKCLG
jgi:hypothetical protein